MWLMGGEVALMHPTRYADLSDDSLAEPRRGLDTKMRLTAMLSCVTGVRTLALTCMDRLEWVSASMTAF